MNPKVYKDKLKKYIVQTINDEPVTPKVEKPKRKIPWTIILFVIGWLATVGIFLFIGWTVSRWWQVNTIIVKAPLVIKYQQPLSIVNRETYNQEQEVARQVVEIERKAIEAYKNPTQAPKCTTEAIESISPKKFWDIIWTHESTKGTNNKVGSLAWKCEQKGGWNEIGYSPSTTFCFHSKAEAELFIPYYVSKNGQGKTMKELLCFYNTGHDSPTCPYTEGNLSLAN